VPAVHQLVHQQVRAVALHREGAARGHGGQPGHQAWHQRGPHQRPRAQADGVAKPAAVAGAGLFGIAHAARNGPAFTRQHFAQRGAAHTEAAALEQLAARARLQGLHVVRERGLRQVQHLAGLADGAAFQDGGQLQQMPGVHRFI